MVVIVVYMVHTHGFIDALVGAFPVDNDGWGVVVINVEGRELPAQNVVHLPILVACCSSQSYVCPAVIEINGLVQVQRRGQNGRVKVIDVDVEKTKACAPIPLASVLKVGILR